MCLFKSVFVTKDKTLNAKLLHQFQKGFKMMLLFDKRQLQWHDLTRLFLQLWPNVKTTYALLANQPECISLKLIVN